MTENASPPILDEISHLTTLLMNAPAFIGSLRGPDHVLELANEKFYELVGRRDIMGMPLAQALPEITAQGFIEILNGVYHSGESFSATEMPISFTHPDGSQGKRFVNFIYQPLRGADNTIQGVFIHGVDVTEQVQTREVAKESEFQLRLMADTMPQIVWVTRPDGFHEYYNQRWYEFIGMSFEESKGEGWGNPLHPDDEARARARWQDSLETGEPYEIEYRFRRFDGQYRWFLARALPVKDAQGTIVKWFGTCTDIDAKRQIEQELTAANQIKDEFLATLSHELRTPLNAILGWAHLLSNGDLDTPTTNQAIETIERSARTQARLIEDLLDVSRILTGKMRLQMIPVELEQCVRGALETVRPAAIAKGVTLSAEIEGGSHLVLGDSDRIRQIAWNLLSNAIKFTPQGGKVTLTLRPTDSGIKLEIKDTGCGISADFLPFVFDRFRQADASTTRTEGGLGIGLGLVRNLTELHGGTTHVESAGLNQGSVFTVNFPAYIVNSREAQTDKNSQPAPLSAVNAVKNSTLAVLNGLKVLVVDDEDDVRTLIGFVLEKQGALVELAESVTEALQKLGESVSQRPFDLLVSDIGMPHRNGYDLIREIRQQEKQSNSFLKAIAVTAYARSEDKERAIQSGFQAHLAKPIIPDALVSLAVEVVSPTA